MTVDAEFILAHDRLSSSVVYKYFCFHPPQSKGPCRNNVPHAPIPTAVTHVIKIDCPLIVTACEPETIYLCCRECEGGREALSQTAAANGEQLDV